MGEELPGRLYDKLKGVSLKKKYYIGIILFFVIYCLFLSWSFLFQNVDDAYISFRYGKNMINGNGLVFNKGEYVEGYTNLLWTVITAPFTFIEFVDVSYFTLTLGLIISILNIFILIKLSNFFNYEYKGMPEYILFLPAIFFALDDSIAFWAIGGMEFPLYTLFILSTAYFYFKINDDKKNIYYLFLMLMFCTLTRPEGNMIFILTIFHMIIHRKEIDNFRIKIIKLFTLYLIFFNVYYGFKYFYYGQIIPNTFYAKGVTDFGMNLILGLKYFALCIGSRFYIFIFILFIPFKKITLNFRFSYLLIFVCIYILYLIAVGGDWMIANRFFVPIIPFMYLLSTIGFCYFINKLSVYFSLKDKLFNVSKFVNYTIIVISLALFITTMAILEYNQLIIKDENAQYEMQWSMFGKWLKKNVPPSTVIAVGPAGKIPYYSNLYTIDMWGLNNAHISKTNSKRLQAGHKKFDFEYVLSFNPEFIIGYAGFTDEEMPKRYEKFNAPEDKYKSLDVVFRLRDEFRDK